MAEEAGACSTRRFQVPGALSLRVPRAKVATAKLLTGIAVLLAITFFARASQNMLNTTAPLLGASALHLPSSAIGAYSTLGLVAQMLTMSLVTARVPQRRTLQALVVGMVLFCLALGLLAIADSQLTFAAAYVLAGIGGGLVFPSLMTAVGRGDPSRRDQRIALLAVALGASLVTGPLLEALVVEMSGGSLRNAFLVFVPLALVALVLSLVAARSRPRRGQSVSNPANGQPPAEPVDAAVPTLFEPAEPASGRGEEHRLLYSQHYRLALTIMLLYQIPFMALLVFGGLLAEADYGLNSATVQLYFAVFFGASLLVRLAVASRRHVRRKMAAFWVSAAATAIGVVLLATGHGAVALLAGMICLGVPHALTFPLAVSLVAEGTPHEHLGRANAQLNASLAAVAATMPFVLGWLVRVAGYRAAFLSLLAPIALFSTLLFVFRSRPVRAAASSR